MTLLIFPAFRSEQLLLRFASTQHSKTVSERHRNRMIVCKTVWCWGCVLKKKPLFYLACDYQVSRDPFFPRFFLGSREAEIHSFLLFFFLSFILFLMNAGILTSSTNSRSWGFKIKKKVYHVAKLTMQSRCIGFGSGSLGSGNNKVGDWNDKQTGDPNQSTTRECKADGQLKKTSPKNH